MTLTRLAGALRAAGLDITFDELRDIEWLAERLTPALGSEANGAGRTVGPARSPVIESLPAESEARPADAAAPLGRTVELHAAEHAGEMLYAKVSGQSASSERARVIRLPGAAALPGALAIGRALRPLSRRRASKWMAFDERETAERIAESRHPVLVYRPARERWFDVIILTDQVPTLAVWRPVLFEFERLLRRQGFRSVRTLKLVTQEGQVSAVRPDGMTVSPHALGDREGRRLVLVASDCTSKSWRSGLMGEWIREVSAHASVAIVQCLPQSLWPNTAVGFAELHVRSAVPATPNARLQVRQPSWAIGEPGVVTPVFSLTPEMVGQWARMVASAGNAWAVAALIPLPGVDGLPDEAADEHGDMLASERLLRFRASATRDAQELAAYFSVVRPLSPPVMRVIQDAMAPSSDAAALAQVFLGGVLYPDGDVTAKEPDDIAYEFHPGLREVLEETLTPRQFIKVNLALHDFLEELSGSSFHFFALLADPNGEEQLPPAALPFAVHARMFARRFGLGTVAAAPRSRRSVATLRISQQLSRFTFEYDGLQPWTKASGQLDISHSVLERLSNTGEAELAGKLAAALVPAGVPGGLAQSAGTAWCELEVERHLLHYPWELLLQTGRNGGLLATRFGFTRRFPRQDARPARAIAADGAIVVGLEERNQTTGAGRFDLRNRIEATVEAIATLGNAVTRIVGVDAMLATDRMPGMPCRFLHIALGERAGHLEPGQQSESIGEQSRWLVQSLIARELPAPELVFSERILGPDLVTDLLDAGTRVIVEPVGAPSAEEMLRFATAFYQWLSKGASLIQALHEGRLNQAEAQQTSDRLGAFACYGEPDWRIRRGSESDLAPTVGNGLNGGRDTISGMDTSALAATPAGESASHFEQRDKAIVAQRELVREAALRSNYALSDDEVLGDVPLIVEPERAIWLVGLVRHILVIGHYDAHPSVADAIAVENLVLVDTGLDELGRARLNFHQNNRSVDYDPLLWPVSFQLQQHVKNLGLLGQTAKAKRLQRALQGRETSIQAFPLDSAFFEIRRASDDVHPSPMPWHPPSFLNFETDWLASRSHEIVHAFDSSIKSDVVLRMTSQHLGGGEKNLLAIPFLVSRPLSLVRLTQSRVDEITAVIRTLDIKSEKAVELIRNGIRAMHRNADGIAWDNPGLGGLLTYSFFTEALSLGHVEYGNPVRLEEVADALSEDELDESEDIDPSELAAWLTEALDYGDVPDLNAEVFNNLRDAVDSVDWDIEVHSQFSSVETDDVYGVLEDWEFGGIGDDGFEAVDYQDDTLTVTRQIVASIRVHASFSFSVKDSIDKDMVYMGSVKAQHVVRANVDAEFEFEGIAKRQPALRSVYIDHIDRYVDFGYVEPNFGNEELEDLDHDNNVRDGGYGQGDLNFGDDAPDFGIDELDIDHDNTVGDEGYDEGDLDFGDDDFHDNAP